MSNVLPLTQWRVKRLAEREVFSDVEDSEDEDSDFEDFTVPVKERKERNSIQKLVTVLLALNKPTILFKFVHIKMQVSSCKFLSFLYGKKK